MKTKEEKFYSRYKYMQLKIKAKLHGMIYRCEKKNSPAYKYYGHKGISVCTLWKDHPEAFIGWCLENNYYAGLDIHRLNPHKDYEPTNCILCTPEDHHYYHSLISKSRKEYNESIRIHDAIQKMRETFEEQLCKMNN